MELKQFCSMGGKARAEKLSKEKRSAIARVAALARWGKVGPMPVGTLTWHNSSKKVIEEIEARRCQAAHCQKVGKEVMVHGLKAWLCEEHS